LQVAEAYLIFFLQLLVIFWALFLLRILRVILQEDLKAQKAILFGLFISSLTILYFRHFSFVSESFERWFNCRNLVYFEYWIFPLHCGRYCKASPCFRFCKRHQKSIINRKNNFCGREYLPHFFV